MTDWTTTGEGGSSAAECMKAGNDLIMPGASADIEAIRDALAGRGAERLELKEVKKCAANLINITLKSNEYEDCVSYRGQFKEMSPFIGVQIEE